MTKEGCYKEKKKKETATEVQHGDLTKSMNRQ